MSRAIGLLDKLIGEVKAFVPGKACSVVSKAATIPKHLVPDIAWRPTTVVPIGHTEYSWYGDDGYTGDSDGSGDCNGSGPSAARTPALEAKSAPPQQAEAKHDKKEKKSKGKEKEKEKEKEQEAASDGGGDKVAEKKKEKPKSDKKQKSGGGGGGDGETGGGGGDGGDVPDFYQLDIRVGRIVECKPHPDADSLYVESIKVGDGPNLTVVSGLVKFVPLDEMIGSSVLVICNLKPNKLRGILSQGMVLAASNSDHTVVELVKPTGEFTPGERVFLSGEAANASRYRPSDVVNPTKKNNAWLAVKDFLRTDGGCVAGYKGQPLALASGVCRAKTVANGIVS